MTDLGTSKLTDSVKLEIFLNYRDRPALDQFIRDAGDRASASYGKFLTPSQFDSRFGASNATRDEVMRLFIQGGFTIAKKSIDASIVEVNGSVGSAQAMFSTVLHDVREAKGRTARMPSVAPAMSAALAKDVTAVLGLNTTQVAFAKSDASFSGIKTPTVCAQGVSSASQQPQMGACCNGQCDGPSPRPTNQQTPSPPTPPPGSQYGNCNVAPPIQPPPGYVDDTTFNSGYAPYTYASDFDFPSQHGCTGSSAFPIAILVTGAVLDSDLQSFYSAMAVQRTGNFIRQHINTQSGDDAEATNDVETVLALAPGADVYFYGIPTFTQTDIINGIMEVDNENVVAVASMSFGGCENQGFTSPYGQASAEDAATAKGAAEGITFVASSGDSGGPKALSGCSSVMAPASVPNVLSVGGTSPYTDQNGYPYQAYRNTTNGTGYNYAWGQSSNNPRSVPQCSSASNYFCGTGGGASTYFKTTDQYQNCQAYKCVPDIALSADIFHEG